MRYLRPVQIYPIQTFSRWVEKMEEKFLPSTSPKKFQITRSRNRMKCRRGGGRNSESSNLSPRRESLTRSDAILDGRDDLPFDTGERRGQLVQRYTVGIRYFRRVSWPRDPRLLSVCTAGSPRERSKRMSDVKCSHPGFIRRTDVPNPLKSQRHSRDIYHNSR